MVYFAQEKQSLCLEFDLNFEEHCNNTSSSEDQAAYVLYLFWQLAVGANQFTEVHGISRAVLAEAVECLGLIFFRDLWG